MARPKSIMTSKKYNFIKNVNDYIEENGTAPSAQDVSNLVGCSRSTGSHMFMRLQDEGFLTKINSKGQRDWCCIRPTRKGREALAEWYEEYGNA